MLLKIDYPEFGNWKELKPIERVNIRANDWSV